MERCARTAYAEMRCEDPDTSDLGASQLPECKVIPLTQCDTDSRQNWVPLAGRKTATWVTERDLLRETGERDHVCVHSYARRRLRFRASLGKVEAELISAVKRAAAGQICSRGSNRLRPVAASSQSGSCHLNPVPVNVDTAPRCNTRPDPEGE